MAKGGEAKAAKWLKQNILVQFTHQTIIFQQVSGGMIDRKVSKVISDFVESGEAKNLNPALGIFAR